MFYLIIFTAYAEHKFTIASWLVPPCYLQSRNDFSLLTAHFPLAWPS